MYRNLTFFRFPTAVAASIGVAALASPPGGPTDLQRDLEAAALKPVGPLELSSRGWLSPYGAGDARLLQRIGDTLHLTLGGEDKVLPSAAVNGELAKRLKAIEEQRGRRPGSRMRKQIRDDVVTELLPRALVKPYRLDGYLDLRRGLAVVDTASRKAAEEWVSKLRATLGSFPALPVNAEVAPRGVLTGWLADDAMPKGLVLGDECRLQDAADGGGVVTVKGEELLGPEVQQHLEAGKQCTRLGMSLNDHLSLTLGEDLVVRKLRFLDGAVDQLESQEREDLQAELDARAALLVGEVGALFDVLEKAFRISKVEG